MKIKRYKKPLEEDSKLSLDRHDQAIHWFPGHMNKALKEVKDSLQKVHLVLEIRDARAPLASSNPALKEIAGQKSRLVIINKTNLALPNEVERWRDYFKRHGDQKNEDYLFLNSFDKNSLKNLKPLIEKIVLSRRDPNNPNRNVRAMIIGLPNTGKSTLINHLVDRKAAKAADKPGLTRQQQWVKIAPGLDLLDTPGIMPPKIEDERQGLWLCAIHAIKDDILGEMSVALFVVKYLMKNAPEVLRDRYQLDQLEELPEYVLSQISRARNHMKKGGILDEERTAKTILQDFRAGDLGQVMFEKAPLN